MDYIHWTNNYLYHITFYSRYNSIKGANTMKDNKFIEEIFELAFGDDAINKDYSRKEVLLKLREFSDDALKLEGTIELNATEKRVLHIAMSFVETEEKPNYSDEWNAANKSVRSKLGVY